MSSIGHPERTTVAVIGLGSIGGVVAGLLAALDRYELVACVRRPLERLVVERPDGAIDIPIRALTDPANNINWTFGPGTRPQKRLPPLLYLTLAMVVFPLLLHWPTHRAMRRVFRPAR